MTKQELRSLAIAVESAVFQSLVLAMEQPENEYKWRKHADKLDSKFVTDFGQHYARVLYG